MVAVIGILAVWLSLVPGAVGLRRQLRRAASPRWDLPAALVDSPPGAYFQLLRPLVAANSLAYCHANLSWSCSLPWTINKLWSGGGTWERLTEFEQHPRPNEAGVFNLAFVDRAARRALLVFKGSCHIREYDACLADLCFLGHEQIFGARTSLYVGAAHNHCSKFSKADLDYIAQARRLTKNLQDYLGPDFSLLLSGHSMGGLLSMIMAIEQPETLQAVTFSPSPFFAAAEEQTQLTEVQLRDLPGVENRVSLGDPFDLLPNTIMVPLARVGSLSCVFDDWDEVEPDECVKKARVLDMLKDQKVSMEEMGTVLTCKHRAHNWTRYTNLTMQRQPDGVSPRWLPNCSGSFSQLTPQLMETASL